MSIKFIPRPMRVEEQSEVATYSLTYDGDIIDYDEQAYKVFDNCGALVYATTEDKYIAITEIGYVSLHDDLIDALTAAF